MKLAVSLLHLRPGQVGGAETYVRQLALHLPAAAAPDRVALVMDRSLSEALATPGAERLVLDVAPARVVAERLAEAFTPWRARAMERAFARLQADVTLFPQQSIFPRAITGPVVMTVVDLQHLYLPGNIPLAERLYRARAYPRSLARADHLIAISEFTRRTLIERAGIAPEGVTAIPLGFEPRAPASANATPPLVAGPYLYFPAATFAHKNHALLFRTYAALKARGALREKLVLSGMQTPRWKGLRRLARQLGIGQDVLHLGFVPFAEVLQLYRGATAVVFPSAYEGFGLPAIEAASLGGKVITGRLPVFEEVGVPAEDRIDFADPEQLLAALARRGPTVLSRRPSTWEDVARSTVAVLRQVARSRT